MRSEASCLGGVGARVLLLLCCALPLLPSCKSDVIPEPCGQGGACPEGQVCDRNLARCVEIPVQPANPELGRHLSVAVAPGGPVWISAQAEQTPPALAVGWLEQGHDLTVELLAEGPGMAEGTSIALLRTEQPAQPCVAFYDAGAGRLLFAQRHGSTWEREQVDGPSGAGPVGRYPSLVLDDDGVPWIAYQDGASGALMVAHRHDGAWLQEVADAPGSGEGPFGGYASLVLLHGQPLVAHYDEGGGNLRLALHEEHGWRSQVIAGWDPLRGDTGDEGRFASAAVDSFGNAAVAFYDATHGTLKLAWNDRGVLKIDEVDRGEGREVAGTVRPTPRVGQYAALAFGRGGQPRLAYLDGASLDLLFASKSDAGWTRRTLVEEGVAGLWAAQAVDADGNSIVAHCRLVADEKRKSGLRHQLEVLWP